MTTRKVRLLGKDKELVSRFFIQTFYSTDNEHLIPIDNGIVMDAIPSVPSMGLNITGNECELPLDNNIGYMLLWLTELLLCRGKDSWK